MMIPTFIPAGKGRTYQLADMKITALLPQHTTEGEYEVYDEITNVGAGSPLHTHIYQWEILEVLEGKYKMKTNDDVHIAEAGSIVIIPPGTPHCFLNIHPAPSKLRIILSPNKNFEGFLMEISAFTTKPDPQQMKGLLYKYGMELLGPPMPSEA